MSLFWWPELKHDLAHAREVISCRRSKLQNWANIAAPRFRREKEFRLAGPWARTRHSKNVLLVAAVSFNRTWSTCNLSSTSHLQVILLD